MLASIAVALAIVAAPAVEPDQPGDAAASGPQVAEAAPEHREELELVAENLRDLPEAKRLFAAGKQAATHDRWEEAIRYFAEAYRYSGSPGQLYSMGRGHRELYFHRGRDPVQLRLALLRLRQYLERSPSGRNRGNAQRFIAELQPYVTVLEGFDDEVVLTRLMVHSPVADATVRVDDGPTLDAPVTVDVEPGPHRVTVQAGGYAAAARTVEVPEGTTLPFEVALSALPATLQVTGPRGAEVFVDGERRGELPMPGPVELAAGPHQVAVARAGRTPFVRELSLSRGDARQLDVQLPMTAQRKAALVTMPVGGAAVVASALLTGLSLRSQHQARSYARDRTTEGVSGETFASEQSAWQQRDAFRTGAIVTGVVGIVTLGTGVVLYVTERSGLADRLYRPDRRVTAGVAVGGRSALATVRGRFGR